MEFRKYSVEFVVFKSLLYNILLCSVEFYEILQSYTNL